MKTVIKNCPAYYYDEEYDYHICKQPLVPYEGNVDYCLDCTDCIIKQIAGLCKENKFFSYGAVMLGNSLSADILNLLEIEEVNE